MQWFLSIKPVLNSPEEEMADFYTYIFHVLHIFCNYFNLALFRGHKPSIIDKALMRLNHPEQSASHLTDDSFTFSVLPRYSSIFQKLWNSFTFWCQSLLWIYIGKINLSLLIVTIPAENWWGIYFIPCFNRNLGYIG